MISASTREKLEYHQSISKAYLSSCTELGTYLSGAQGVSQDYEICSKRGNVEAEIRTSATNVLVSIQPQNYNDLMVRSLTQPVIPKPCSLVVV